MGFHALVSRIGSAGLPLCLLATGPVALGQGTLFVDQSAPPGGSGASWSVAFQDLQDALAVAAPGDRVWVAAGSYRPDQGSLDRDRSFELIADVELFGGFPAGGGGWDARRPAVNRTVLTGDLLGDDQPGFVGIADNSKHVVTCQIGAGATTTLDGFAIEAGNANVVWEGGGGMLSESGDPTLRGVSFLSNWGDTYGGGLSVRDGAATLESCHFEGNSASSGGAIWTSGDLPLVSDCVFKQNFGTSGPFSTGGIRNVGAIDLIEDCLFIENDSVYAGGGMVNDGVVTRMSRCRFLGNSGGTYVGGGYYNSGYTAEIENCLFSGNHAGSGGGLNNFGTIDLLVNSTFSRNASDNYGGGINNAGSLYVSNCVFWENTALIGSLMDWQVRTVSPGTVAMDFTCIEGLLAPGSGNIGTDPRFIDADGPDNLAGTLDDDLRLDLSSPAIDAGDNTAVPAGVVLDLSGDRRFVEIRSAPNTGIGRGPLVDLGAYERQQGQL